MVWKTFQRLGRVIQARQVSIVTASATVVVGLVLYEKLKVEKVAHADFRPGPPDSESKQGSGDWATYSYTLSSSKTGIKWDENWDK